MIQYVVKDYHECELADFPAWGGAVPQLKQLKEHPKAMAYVEGWIDVEQERGEEEVTDEYINDLLWFDLGGILDFADLYDWRTNTIYDEPFGWEEEEQND